jgi:hypothetical protein
LQHVNSGFPVQPAQCPYLDYWLRKCEGAGK